jgi:soluble lytic murein transglycosylase-like protein
MMKSRFKGKGLKGLEIGPAAGFSIFLVLFAAGFLLMSFSSTGGRLYGIEQFFGGTFSKTATDSIVREASAKYGVEQALIKAVIKQESDFDPGAESSNGAQGLMQLTPALVSGLNRGEYGCKERGLEEITDPFDPEQNINGGTCYLSYLLEENKNKKDMALAAYKAGSGSADAREIQNYVVTVIGYYNDYRSGAK